MIVIGQEKNLVVFGNSVVVIDNKNVEMFELIEQIVVFKLQVGVLFCEIVVVNQLVMLIQWIVKNVLVLCVGDEINFEVVFLFGKDINVFCDVL